MLSEKEFAGWLNQPENVTFVRKLASAVQKRLAAANLRLPGTEHESDPRHIHEVIFQELALFLIQTPKLQAMLCHDPDAATATVIRSFLNQATNMVRSKPCNRDVYKDNWRAFRRHVLAILRESEDFIKFSAHKDMAFAMSDQARPVFIPPEKTFDIPYPADVPSDFERMNHKKQILKLAVHFWSHCAQTSGLGPVRINLNDFISWISRYVLLQLTCEIPAEDDSPISRISDPAPDYEKNVCLKTWAGNFFNRLDPRGKQIFYYYHCKGYTGKQVARLMGKKSHQSYQRNRVLEDLKQFLAPLDWLSPAPEKGNAPADPNAFDVFMTELCAALGRHLEREE